ncbi:MAG: hypothetical protein K5663_11400 [Clostridiales bacterium]|nr:hypothetical protein [Clostridiales bacterium]
MPDIRYAATLAFLKQCPALSGLLGFEAAAGGNIRVLTQGTSAANNRKYIDGSEGRAFDFVIEFYKPLNTLPYIAERGEGNQNLKGVLDVQELISWLDDMRREGTEPDFGDKCVIDDVKSLNNEPVLAWVDTQKTPPIAKYTVTVRVEYTDYTNSI